MSPLEKHQQRRQERRAKAEMRAMLSRDQGDYVPADREECGLPHESFMPVDDSASLRITTRIWRLDGRMTEFALHVESGDWANPDAWEEVARIDCKGGTCHLHPPENLEDHRTLYRLDSLEDVEKSFPEANSKIHEIARMIRDRRTK